MLEVYINNTLLDISENAESLKLIYSVEALEDPSKVSSTFAERSLVLPASKTNRSILEDNQERLPAEIYSNNIKVFEGFAQVAEVPLTGTNFRLKDKEYKVNFFGSNASWFSQIKDLNLSALDLTSSNHTLDETTVLDGLYTNIEQNSTFGYCLIKYCNFQLLDAVSITEFTPFLWLSQLVRKIINFAGYKVESNFLESDFARSLIFPCYLPNKLGDQYAEDYLNIRAERTITDTITIPKGLQFSNLVKSPPLQSPAPFIASDASLGFGAPSAYIVPIDGFYKVRGFITIDNVVKAPLDDAIFFINIISNITGFIGGAGFAAQLGDSGRRIDFEGITEAVTGERIYIQIFAGLTNPPTVSIDITDLGEFEVIGEAKIKEGLDIDFKYLLQDFKAGDLIKNLPFNLRFSTDETTKIVTIEPAHDYPLRGGLQTGFYRSTTNALFCDLGREARKVNLLDVARKKQFLYATDETTDTLNDDRTETIEANSAIYDLGENFDDKTDEDDKTFFVLSNHLLDGSIKADDSDKTPLVPLLWSADYNEETSVNLEDRVTLTQATLLIKPELSTRTAVDGRININTAAGVQSFINPVSFAFNYNDETGEDYSLKFATENLAGLNIIGLFRRFYLQDYANIKNAKQIDLYALFNFTDILSFSFRNMFVLDNKEYIIQSIEFEPSKRDSTKIVVLENVIPTQEDEEHIENSLVNTLFIT